MALWAGIALVMLAVCFWKCEETVQIEAAQTAKVPLGQNLKALFVIQYFWSTLVMWTVTVVHGTIVGTSLPYYCKYIFQNDTWMYSVLYLAETGTLVIGAMLCPLLLRRYGKRNMSLVGAIVAVAAQAAVLVNPYSFPWLLGTSIIRALGEAPLTALVFGMMGDVVEFGQWKTHIRQEALIFGGGSLGFKIGSGVTSSLLTRMLDSAGYISSTGQAVVQPQTAIDMIRNIYVWGPTIVWVIAVIALVLYRLDNKTPTIMKELAEREARGEL